MKKFTEEQSKAVKILKEYEAFHVFVEYLKEDLEDAKNQILEADNESFRKWQGMGVFLHKLITDIESTS